jgi:plastocyanin
MESTRNHHRVTITARMLSIALFAGLSGCGTAAAPSPSEAAAPPTTAPTAAPTATAESTRPPTGTKCAPPAAVPAEVAEGTVTIIAPLGAAECGFSANAISAPVDAAFAVVLVVEDNVLPHNFSLYTDPGFQDPIAEGKYANAADPAISNQVTTDVPALAAGIYYFRCDSHARQMVGTVTSQ